MAGGLLDAQVHVGVEATYNALPVTVPTRSFEAKSDVAKAKFDRLQSVGMRAGLEAPRFDRSRVIPKGAEGSLELDVLPVGLGMILKASLGTSTTEEIVATSVYKQTHQSAPAAPADSLVVQIGRPVINPTTAPLPFTYSGGKVTEWTLEQKIGDEAEGLLHFNATLDYAVEHTDVPLMAVPVYPVTDWVYGWPDCKITLAGATLDTEEFEFTSSQGLATERFRLRQSTAKQVPIRGEFPKHSGSMTADFADLSIYDLVRSGDPVLLVAEWIGPQLDAGPPVKNAFFKLTSTVQLVGETPEVSLSEFPKQPIEFVSVKNDTDPAVKIEYQTSDVSY